MTAGTAIRASLSVPGHPDQVRAARAFTSKTLGDDHPCAPAAVLLVSELVTNSVLHSDSRLPGGTVTVTVTGTADVARVEVRDAGGTSVPFLKGAGDGAAEGGHGLRLVDYLAARWDYRRDAAGLITWFEVRAEPPS
jgi:anti-sigma regulatory factor (Ser/Thr protein kinase)